MKYKKECKKGFHNCTLFAACKYGGAEKTEPNRIITIMLEELKYMPPVPYALMQCIIELLVNQINCSIEHPDFSIVIDRNYLENLVRIGQLDRGFEPCFYLP